MAAAMPTVPKIIIRTRPSQPPPKVQHHMPSYQTSNMQAPDYNSNASRIPNAPVHHMSPPTKFSDDQSNQSSDSDESDSNLQISQPFRTHQQYQQRPQPPKQQQQMPFIRPDHTLLPKQRSPSLSPSPPPPSLLPQSSSLLCSSANLLSTSGTIGHSASLFASSNQSMHQQQQQTMFNGGTQYRSKQENSSRNDSSNKYCYCRQPYDETQEMIACDAQDCAIEWFHFKCVGITVATEDKWFCPECRARSERHAGNFTKSTALHQNSNPLYTMARAAPQPPLDLA